MKKETCLFPDCGTEERGRGLCIKHYVPANDAVNAGLTDWDELEKLGLSKRVDTRTKGKRFMDILKERREQAKTKITS